MVSLNKAVTLILKRAEEGTDAGEASRELELSWNANLTRVIEIAAGYLARHHRVLTISYSGLVRDAILKTKAQSCTPEVYLGEGRPKYEGLALARELADEGVPCTVFADSAFAGFICDVDCVLIGADAISSSFLLNKIGTTAILREAKARDVPTAVAYDFLKEVEDAEFPDAVADYPAEELLADAGVKQTVVSNESSNRFPNCLRVVNRYFEFAPRSLLDVEMADSF
jgi:translation initiation factor 2B subunit (eIF-2B alpha/beta/delta family)